MKKVLLVFLLLTSALSARIIETAHMENLLNYVSPGTLIVFDIDNTLIEPCQELGSDQWFYHKFKAYEQNGMETHCALEKALSEWMAVQNISKMKLVEECAGSIVHLLQENGYTVIGLTTRGLGMSTRTNEQLKNLGINLSRTAPSKEDFFFMNGRGVLFREGTVFTANTHKGRALFTYLDHIGYKPERIIFINDKLTHIIPIEEWANERGIPFLGLRYSYLDEKVKNLNIEIADIQWEHFGHILSDTEAKKIAEDRWIPPSKSKSS